MLQNLIAVVAEGIVYVVLHFGSPKESAKSDKYNKRNTIMLGIDARRYFRWDPHQQSACEDHTAVNKFLRSTSSVSWNAT